METSKVIFFHSDSVTMAMWILFICYCSSEASLQDYEGVCHSYFDLNWLPAQKLAADVAVFFSRADVVSGDGGKSGNRDLKAEHRVLSA